MKLSKAEAALFSRLFSAGVFRDLENSSRSELLGRLLAASGLEKVAKADEPLANVLDAAFRILRLSDVRGDYVFRTALIERILLGRHNLRTASALSEFRVAGSKADVVIINGTSTAYEIKSDRDSLARLPDQMQDYRKHFAQVVVVASECHLSVLEGMVPRDVGILSLSKKLTLRSVREPIARPELIDSVSLLNAIRVGEAKSVVKQICGEVPDVPNTSVRATLARAVQPVDPIELHDAVFRVLRESRSQAPLGDFIKSLPISMRSVALARNPSQPKQQHVKSALSTPFGEALTWR